MRRSVLRRGSVRPAGPHRHAGRQHVAARPVLYRIRRAHHHRTGDRWIIYPTYDWAHGQVGAIEGTTHSICTLEFAEHRPLYDWCLDHVELPSDRPEQTEFACLNLTHTVLSSGCCARWSRTGWSTAGTTPGCRPCRVCDAAVPGRGAAGVLRSHLGGQDELDGRDRGCSRASCAPTTTVMRWADGGARPAQADDHQLARGPRRVDGRHQQPRGRRRGDPGRAVHRRAVDRA